MTLLRVPLAAAFLLTETDRGRLAIVAAAAASDLADGPIARRLGSSAIGPLLDPIADKVFMGAAFTVVALSGRLEPYEVGGVLLRDILATLAYAVTLATGRPRAIPARLGGKAVTAAQALTLFAFLTDSPHLRPMAWATSAIAIYAVWDYSRAVQERDPAGGR